MPRMDQSLYIGLGSAGAMVDVTSSMDLEAGFDRRWGRDTGFEDTNPGEFSFTLDNGDGRFTPENTVAALAAGFSTTLTEGMSVCHELGGARLVHGTVQAIQPAFPGDEAAWSQVVVTCDDMLGNAARHTLTDLAAGTFAASSGLLLWKLDDAPGSALAAESTGSTPLTINLPGDTIFGVMGTRLPVEPAVALSGVGGDGALRGTNFPVFEYGTSSIGVWNFWYQQTVASDGPRVVASALSALPGGGGSTVWTIQGLNDGALRFQANGSSVLDTPAMATNVARYVEVRSSTVLSGTWTLAFDLYIDGVLQGSRTYSASVLSTLDNTRRSPSQFYIGQSAGTASTIYYSRVSHTLLPLDEQYLLDTSASSRIEALARTTPEITLDSLPALGAAPLGADDFDGRSTFDALNDVMRAEQGAIYSETTGTLTSPVEKVKVRARDRVEDVDYTFDVEGDAQGATDFIRDLTNMAQAVTVDGPEATAFASDATLFDRVGSKNVTENVPLRDYVDLFTWGTDRLWRGANVRLRAASLTIDAMTTPTDRSADLLAMVPGDRIQITGLPSTVLGFSTWDGWLLGVDEVHSIAEHTFTMYLQPCLPDTAIYDTDCWMAGGVLTLSADIDSSVTSISVATSDSLTKFTTAGGDFPVDVIIGTERMTATACTSATPQVMTVTRGVGGTTADSHTAGDALELADDSLYGF